MKTFTAEVLVLFAATAIALPELQLAKRDARGARSLRKRDGGTVGTDVFDVLAWSSAGSYYVNVTVGTPPQQQTLILATGASDTQLDASTAQECQLPISNSTSCRGGTFDPGSSVSYSVVAPSPAFNTTYGDGSYAIGPYATDVLGLGDIVLEDVQFGLADQLSSTTGYAIGLLGIGYSANEATSNQYPNLPEALVDAGVINSRLYSIFLNDLDAISGTILFGGIDTSKYTGELVTIDLNPAEGSSEIFQFLTTVTALSAITESSSQTGSGSSSTIFSGGSASAQSYQSNDSAIPVLLDTGTASWTIPTQLSDAFFAAFPFLNASDPSDLTCSCDYQTTGASLTVEIAAAVKINVPASNFIVPLYNAATNEPLTYDNGTEVCVFDIYPGSPDGGQYWSLGLPVLRSMYVVFDLDNGQVSIAQAAVGGSSSPDVRTVAAGPNGVQSAATNVQSAAPQTNSIDASISDVSTSFSAATAQSTIGTATGTAALPADAQVSSAASVGSILGGTATSGSSTVSSTTGAASAMTTTSASASASSSKAAAANVVMPGMHWSTLWLLSSIVAAIGIGAGMVL